MEKYLLLVFLFFWIFWPFLVWAAAELLNANAATRISLTFFIIIVVYLYYAAPLQAVFGVMYIGYIIHSAVGLTSLYLFAVPVALGLSVFSIITWCLETRTSFLIAPIFRSFISASLTVATFHLSKDVWINYVVEKEAVRTAASRPYTLSKKNMGQRVIEVMRAAGVGDSPPLTPHALLLTEEACFYWSYRHVRFVRFPDGPKRRQYCGGVDVELGFDGRRDVPDQNATEFLFDGSRYVIPKRFRPSGNKDYLRIMTNVSDFSSLEKNTPQRLGITVWKMRRLFTYGGVVDRPVTGKVGPFIFSASHVGQFRVHRYYRYNDKSELDTVIVCTKMAYGPEGCNHQFYFEGKRFSFAHKEALVEGGEALQQAVVDFLSSFKSGPAKAPF